MKQIKAAVSAARGFKSDYLGFGKAFQRKNPRGWKKIKDHWEEVFTTCGIRFEADVVIRHTDMRGNSFSDQLSLSGRRFRDGEGQKSDWASFFV
ncbi:Ger(x)C family spore germination C-terminal domain-containing protein [Paenibacillus rhizoplanae]